MEKGTKSAFWSGKEIYRVRWGGSYVFAHLRLKLSKNTCEVALLSPYGAPGGLIRLPSSATATTASTRRAVRAANGPMQLCNCMQPLRMRKALAYIGCNFGAKIAWFCIQNLGLAS